MKNLQPFLWGCAITSFILGIIFLRFSNKQENNKLEVKETTQKDTQKKYSTDSIYYNSYRGYDYKNKTLIRQHHITDDELRQLRRDNPEFIIKAPGRRVLSEEEEFNKKMEEWLEDNHQEVIDRYRD